MTKVPQPDTINATITMIQTPVLTVEPLPAKWYGNQAGA